MPQIGSVVSTDICVLGAAYVRIFTIYDETYDGNVSIFILYRKGFEENRAFTLAIGSMIVSGIFLFGMFANKYPFLFQILIILVGIGTVFFMFLFEQQEEKKQEEIKKLEEKIEEEKEESQEEKSEDKPIS